VIVNAPSDQTLIEQCLAGRRDARGQLVERYQHRLYHGLWHALGSAEDAQDIAQEVFVNAFEKLVSFTGQAAFCSWLFRIAPNAATSARRKTRRMSASVESRREDCGLEPSDENPTTEPSYAMDVSDRQPSGSGGTSIKVGSAVETRIIVKLKTQNEARWVF
jgi:RNA polymerase sigma-70 factor (ECF subfamily)